MLSKSYRQKRPRNKTSMAERLAYLRSVRDRGLHMNSQEAPLRREVIKECAILLKAHPKRRNANTARLRDSSGELEDLDLVSSPPDQEPDTASNPSRRSLDTGEPRTSFESETTDAEEPSFEMFKNPWSTCEDGRYEKYEFLRERCPSRSSSFLADVASLISGLSIRSSLSRSSSGSSRRSVRSVSSNVEPSGSGAQSGWDAERPHTAISMAESLAWSAEMDVAAPAGYLSSAVTAWAVEDVHRLPNPGSTSHTLENQELVRFCCSKTSWCIHQRINAVLMHGSPASTFACTAAEASSRDGLGNTALHVAARWGAPGPVLFRIMTLASHPGATNHHGETFLHVLDPISLTPKDLSHLTQFLTTKAFNFTHADRTNQTFLSRLLSRPSFTLDALEATLGHFSSPTRLTLLHHPSPGHLLAAVRTRLPTPASAAAYATYFTARYGTQHHPVWITPTLLCHIPQHHHHQPSPPTTVRTPLHSLISALNVGPTFHPPAPHPLVLNRPSMPFLTALSLTLDAYPADADVNHREAGTLQTPLIALLRGLSWGGHAEEDMARMVGLMLARGARVGVADAEGKNALHWAGKLGLVGVVRVFCGGGEGEGAGRGLVGVRDGRGRTVREIVKEVLEGGGVIGEGGGLVRSEGGKRVGRWREVEAFLEGLEGRG